MASYNNMYDMMVMVALLMFSTGAYVAFKYATRALREGKVTNAEVKKVVEVVAREGVRRRRRNRTKKHTEDTPQEQLEEKPTQEKGSLAAVTAVAALAVMTDARGSADVFKTEVEVEVVQHTMHVQPLQPIEILSDMDTEKVIDEEEVVPSQFSLFGKDSEGGDIPLGWNPLKAQSLGFDHLVHDIATSASTSDSPRVLSEAFSESLSEADLDLLPELLCEDEDDDELTATDDTSSLTSYTESSSASPSRCSTPTSMYCFSKELDFFKTHDPVDFILPSSVMGSFNQTQAVF
eukprot:TRINITY_DN22808_c0_g1_i1.p1 TRINITY_DN22808_c0_g1~~TRINITY_DN22808_c0_g1_i1.p1  ORF type:complete len:292 (+),score=101.01 TRINITY_DN22808_c0_g1_i1:57-932(+)